MIGSRIVALLAKYGASITVLDSMMAYPFDAQERFGVCQEGVKIVRGDLVDRDLVCALAMGQEYIIHAAALADVAACINDYSLDFEMNIRGTSNILHAALLARPNRFIFISSASIYGNTLYGNTLEKRIFAETDPCNPQSTYANSKAWGERQTSLFCDLYGLSGTSLRYFSAYGPPQIPKRGSHSWCVAVFAAQALRGRPVTIYGDGNQIRDFVFVDDLAEGTLIALLTPEARGKTLNLGTGRGTEILEVARTMVRRVADVPIHFYPRPAGDPLGGAADTVKMRATLSWQPRIDLESGIDRYLNWITQNLDLLPD